VIALDSTLKVLLPATWLNDWSAGEEPNPQINREVN
jgi:hypothetical protein